MKPLLTKNAKQTIVKMIVERGMTRSAMAEYYKVSTRTIGRVLDEFGHGTLPRMTSETYQIMNLIHKNKITYSQLEKLIKTVT